LLNKDRIETLTFAEARWNVEKKQQEINNLEATHQLNQEIIQQKVNESRQQKLILWFIVGLLFLTVVSGVVVILYLRKRRDALHQKQLMKISALRMQNARNTMTPHFFFNILATMAGLSAHPQILKDKMKSLSLLLRKVIENIDRTAVTLDEELSAVRAFVDLSSDKIPAPFVVEYLIEEGTELHRLVPAMMIQIPVETQLNMA
jgi:two-component system, LytTR family, sensor kinase